MQMDLEGITLSEISQRKIPYDLTVHGIIKQNKLINTKYPKTTKLIDTENRLVITSSGVGGGGEMG